MARSRSARRWLKWSKVAAIGIVVTMLSIGAWSLLDEPEPKKRRAPLIVSESPTTEPTSQRSRDSKNSSPSPEGLAHQIDFFASSDGSLGAVQWRTAVDASRVVKISATSWSLSRSVVGRVDIPIAQMTVQVIPPATSARCTIRVDGELTSSQTARGPYQLAICNA